MHAKNRFDVLIVGAGPAGASAAFILANNGYRVAVIEKKGVPRFKLCGGLLSQKTIKLRKDVFNVDGGDLEANGVIHCRTLLLPWIGDAGGFSDPFLGEGIYYGHRRTQLACIAIRQSFNRPQNVLTLYTQLLN